MIYCALTHGATGLEFWLQDCQTSREKYMLGPSPAPPAHYGSEPYTPTGEELARSVELWNSLDAGQSGLLAELASLKPVILSRTAPDTYEVLVSGNTLAGAPVRCLLKNVGGQRWLLVTNITKDPAYARIRFDRRIYGVTDVEGKIVVMDTSPFSVDVFLDGYLGDTDYTAGAIQLSIVGADFDSDGDVDFDDASHLLECISGPYPSSIGNGCADADVDGDGDVDLRDFALLQKCFNGAHQPPACP